MARADPVSQEPPIAAQPIAQANALRAAPSVGGLPQTLGVTMPSRAPRPNNEVMLAISCIAIGMAVAATLAPRDAFFLPNFLFFWGTQVAIIALAALLKPRPAVLGGVSLALAIYLGSFGAWLFTRTHPESMAWLGFVFSLPGAAIAAVGVTLWQKNQVIYGPIRACLFATCAVLLGVSLNQVVVCSTVMYCGAK